MRTDAKYLHVKEVAAELRQHPATVYRKIHAGEIPHVRLGGDRSALRVDRSELERWLHESHPRALSTPPRPHLPEDARGGLGPDDEAEPSTRTEGEA
jgi:excisionase family DNA binding protein